MPKQKVYQVSVLTAIAIMNDNARPEHNFQIKAVSPLGGQSYWCITTKDPYFQEELETFYNLRPD